MSKPFLIVVDDEPDLGVTIARAVKTLGFDVQCVTDAYAFKAIWSTREPTTILCAQQLDWLGEGPCRYINEKLPFRPPFPNTQRGCISEIREPNMNLRGDKQTFRLLVNPQLLPAIRDHTRPRTLLRFIWTHRLPRTTQASVRTASACI